MEERELDLREIIAVLRRRLFLLIAVPAVATLVAALVSLFVMQPVYSASTTLWVIKDGTTQIDYNTLLANRNLTKTYSEVAKSRAVMADAAKSLGITNITVEAMQRKLTVTPLRDTEILVFSITDKDPQMAARLVDAVAVAFRGQLRSFMKVENVAVVDPAQVPVSPIKPRTALNVAIAFVLGGIAAVGLIFLLEYLDNTIKTPEDISRHLGLPVLAVIPYFEVGDVPRSDRGSRGGGMVVGE